MSKHNPQDQIALLEKIASGDFSDMMVRIYLKGAAKEILGNIKAGKAPNADHAMHLHGKNQNASKWRNADIAVRTEQLYREYGNQNAAFKAVSEMAELKEATIERIYKGEMDFARQTADFIERLRKDLDI